MRQQTSGAQAIPTVIETMATKALRQALTSTIACPSNMWPKVSTPAPSEVAAQRALEHQHARDALKKLIRDITDPVDRKSLWQQIDALDEQYCAANPGEDMPRRLHED